MCDKPYTIGDYLRGKVRGITIPDESLLAICADVPVCPDQLFSELTDRERELSLAWMYVWMAGGPIQSGSVRDADADWSHTEGGERLSANVLKRYLDMANDIFEKYDLPLFGAPETWGFVGRGFCNPRRIR